MLAHGAVTLQSQIFTGAQLEAIARDYRQAGLAPAEVAMMAFAEKVAGPAYTVTSDDVESLRRHGFSDTDVLDIAFAAAARCFFSKVLDGVGAAMPTSTTVEVRRLAHPDFLVEIEVVAMTG